MEAWIKTHEQKVKQKMKHFCISGSSSLTLPKHIHTTLKQSLYSSVASDSGSGRCRGRFSGHPRWRAYFGCHLGCCIIVLFTGHGLIISTALFIGEQTDSCRHWSDQSVSRTRAEAIWCILTIIGATATMMFSKPLCYFPGGCPWGIFWVAAALSAETPSESGQMEKDCCPLHITDTTT